MARRRLGCRSRASRARTALAVGVAAVASLAAPVALGAGRGAPTAPARLADTGLYSDFDSRKVDERNVHYTPQYPLWSDGAAKQRWMYLPPGSAIDARNPEEWVFPVGTRFWKEFSWSSRPVETRYLERTRKGWTYAVYVWTDDGTDAVLAPEAGVTSAQEVAPGRRHVVPSRADCLSCHRGGRTEILGFSALQLSPDRDPLAPNAEPVQEGDVDLAKLVERGLVRGLPRAVLDPPPRIVASTPRGRAARGYLHANCAGCHDSRGPMASLGVSLRHVLGAREERDQPASGAIGHPTAFALPGAAPGTSVWIAPGDPSASAVVRRMESRRPAVQMPPLATKLVDEEALALVKAWIEEDLRASVAAGDPPQPRRHR
jgi:mono/diheme cytochrome c family protein